ncbi:hypothetical protein [Streptomyces sp. NRRL WC-3626]|nr:hypothetical protein [Streptomyces sp. NRRL WC-3626]
MPASIVSRIELPGIDNSGVSLTPAEVTAAAVAMREIEPRYEYVTGPC